MNSNINKISSWMKAQVGSAEHPLGSNNIVYNTHYYGHEVMGDAYPWCVTFLWAGFNACDLSSVFLGGQKTAAVSYVMDWAQRHGCWVTDGYREGDLLCYGTAHIGYCLENHGSYVTAIEGNYSDCVSRVDRRPESITGAYRPEYGDDIPQTEEKPHTEPQKPQKPTEPESALPPLPAEEIKPGDIVKISAGAHYWDGSTVPFWVLNREWIIRSVYGERAVINRCTDGAYSIMSAINIRYLHVIKTAAEDAAERACATEYMIKPGDTLWDISKRFLGSGTKYRELMKENGLKNTNIYPGQVLKIPKKS